MKNILLKTGLAALSLVPSLVLAQSSGTEQRREAILRAMNVDTNRWLAPITASNVKLGQAHGRVDVNEKSKFSYYVQADSENFGEENVTLIPMATSRFSATAYQTDDWWDAHKSEINDARRSGKSVPRQDEEEVAKWLQEMKLSSNPDVFLINEREGSSKTVPLQDYLLRVLTQSFGKDGTVTLYRGAEIPGEVNSWVAGRVPRGARYWTPTAMYAWRYARKNTNFVKELLKGQSPLFAFEVSASDLADLNRGRYPKLTFGTELTVKAHQNFDSSGLFKDHLSNMEYIGSGELGTEIEVRASRAGAEAMVRAFRRPVGARELAQDFEKNFLKAQARIDRRSPGMRSTVDAQIEGRIRSVRLEADILEGIQAGKSREELEPMAREVRSLGPQITNIDGFDLLSFIQTENLDLYRNGDRK